MGLGQSIPNLSFYIRTMFRLLFLFVCGLASAQDTIQKVTPGRINSPSQQEKPYVILISADGFRYDYLDKYDTPNLNALKKSGVSAPYMSPAYPSLTFPNHYSIVTGLYPAHHGLVDNNFYDRKRNTQYSMIEKDKVHDGTWYGGTPIWVLAEQQKMLSASFYWVASESDVQGVRPTYYYNYNELIDIDTRLRTLKDWLQLPSDKRPHFITFYFHEVDKKGHLYGPDAKETEEAVQFVDQTIGKMAAMVKELNLPVNFVFVSDHGMVSSENNYPLLLPEAVDSTKFIIPFGKSQLHLYAKDKKNIKPTYKALLKEAVHFTPYLKKDIPKAWRYNKKSDKYGRVGDILLIPNYPKIFVTSPYGNYPGQHGYDPAFPEMHATFLAWGPAFKEDYVIEPFENVNLYPLISKILGLPYQHKIDGDLKVLEKTLKE